MNHESERRVDFESGSGSRLANILVSVRLRPAPPLSGHPCSPPWNSLGLELACGMVGWFGLGLLSMRVPVIIPRPFQLSPTVELLAS